MCTVTFIARQRGYCLGMNRDEQLTRLAGLPPSEKIIAGRRVLSPSEPAGGTWISLNDSGIAFALINWYAITARVRTIPLSRGEVVKAVSALDSPDAVAATLESLPLKSVNPFRLIGIFPAGRQIFEWSLDWGKLARRSHSWRARQWISSGFDEPGAQRVRGRSFRRALQQRYAGSLAWLRRLHRSHAPQIGPLSTCMHRAGAATVSYTELSITPRAVTMRYHPGAPCQCPTHGTCLVQAARNRVISAPALRLGEPRASAACDISLPLASPQGCAGAGMSRLKTTS